MVQSIDLVADRSTAAFIFSLFFSFFSQVFSFSISILYAFSHQAQLKICN